MKNLPETREQRVEFVRQKLLRDGFPHVLMSGVLLLTALTGFLVSFGLLHAGFFSMALRYPVCIAAAYCVFLLLLRVWLWMQTPHSKSDSDLPDVDLPDTNLGDLPVPSSDFSLSNIASPGISSVKKGGTAFDFGGGGDFSGGGAGGSWGTGVSSSSSGGGSSWDAAGFDLDDFVLIALAVAAIIGGLLASLYIIWIAPVLLAEILVDGVLVAGLYKRVKKVEQRYWLKTAVAKTLLPAVLAALLFGAAGFAMQVVVPEAHSAGEVLYQIKHNKPNP